MKRWFLWIILFCAGLTVGGVGGWQVGKAQSAGLPEEGIAVGQRPPRFSVTDLSGATQTLDQYEDNILVLHFWASWCPYCRGEVPKLKTLHEEWAWKGINVLTVSIDEDLEQLDNVIRGMQLPYPVIADEQEGLFLAERFGIETIPVTFIIDTDGRTVFRTTGQSDILGLVENVLDEQDASPST